MPRRAVLLFVVVAAGFTAEFSRVETKRSRTFSQSVERNYDVRMWDTMLSEREALRGSNSHV